METAKKCTIDYEFFILAGRFSWRTFHGLRRKVLGLLRNPRNKLPNSGRRSTLISVADHRHGISVSSKLQTYDVARLDFEQEKS